MWSRSAAENEDVAYNGGIAMWHYSYHPFFFTWELGRLSPLLIGVSIAIVASLVIGRKPHDGVPAAPKLCRGCGASSPNFAKFCKHCGRAV